MIAVIAGRELRSMFLSPLAWSLLAALQFIIAYVFFGAVDYFTLNQARAFGSEAMFGVTDIVVVASYSWLGFLLLTIMPLMTMGLISRERERKTLTLLLSSPISATSIIIGKFLAIQIFAALIIFQVVLMSLPLEAGTHLVYGQITSTVIGMLLLSAAFISIGLYISCLTGSPAVAAVITYCVLIFLFVIYFATTVSGGDSKALLWFSIMQHQSSFQRGLINSSDIAYYVIIIVTFILFSIRRLDAERLQY